MTEFLCPELLDTLQDNGVKTANLWLDAKTSSINFTSAILDITKSPPTTNAALLLKNSLLALATQQQIDTGHKNSVKSYCLNTLIAVLKQFKKIIRPIYNNKIIKITLKALGLEKFIYYVLYRLRAKL